MASHSGRSCWSVRCSEQRSAPRSRPPDRDRDRPWFWTLCTPWEKPRAGRGRIAAMLRWLTAGESHGPALVAILEGLPAGVQVTSTNIQAALARRRLGYGRGARMAFEADELEIVGGLRHGSSMGSPIALRIGNSEWPKWDQVMSADPVDPDVLAGLKRNAPLTRPRPGHADLAGMQKYDFDEARPVLERASARETAARVALGAVSYTHLR